jgi:hypothetical protein
MTAAVELARRYPNARLVFTGGSASFPHEGLVIVESSDLNGIITTYQRARPG